MELVTRILPAHWASALINGDESGLTAADREHLDEYIAEELERYEQFHTVDVSDESWFARDNDAGGLAGDVAQYTFAIN